MTGRLPLFSRFGLTGFSVVGSCLLFACFPASASETSADPSQVAVGDAVYFEKHVRPILKVHCFLCHGEEPELSGELDLRLVRLMQSGGETGPVIVPERLEQSLLWMRITGDEMPPGPKKLSAAERAVIASWIQQGARTARPEPENPAEARFTEEELAHWAFQPVSQPPLPDMPADLQHLGPVDRFIEARLREQGLVAAPAADRATLLRRLSLNLTGLLPSPEELTEYELDASDEAYQKVVDRLLASPQYGVRWARHWLDVSGYAESEGQIVNDRQRLHAWRYRDYVVDAFNRDLPYDQFLIEQLAGDQLIDGSPDPNSDEHVRLLSATGFLQMAPDLTQTENTLLNRNQAVADTVATVTSSILGLTVACAQCHDHRYDPVTIEDYYRLRAIFDPAMPVQQWKKPSERLVDMTSDETRAERSRIEAEAVALQEDINARRRAHCRTIQDREINAAPADVREALRTAVDTPQGQQTADQKALLERYPKVRTIDWIVGQLVEYDNPAHRAFQEEEKQVAVIRETKPIDRLIMTVRDARTPPPSHVYFRGDPQSPTIEVQPGELSVLAISRQLDRQSLLSTEVDGCSRTDAAAAGGLSDDDKAVQSEIVSRPLHRLQYARQLTDGTHPLVARVIVNRIWQHHFGQGLVRTPGDFGLNGQRPTHPELLDWLASEFVRQGWSLKHLHRQIVSTRAYQQISGITETETVAAGGAEAGLSSYRLQMQKSRENDPDNRWLSRMSLRRLDAEALRDSILSVSGQLNDRLHGPSVPVAEDNEGKAVIGTRILRDGLFAGIRDPGDEAWRRSLYLSAHRSLQLNMLQTFDLPAMNPNCQQRSSSTVAPQALLFMNDNWIVDASDRMATRIRSKEQGDSRCIELAFRLAYAHPPTPPQQELCRHFLEQQVGVFQQDPNQEWQKRLQQEPELARQRALASLCQMLLASNRFIYVQ